MRDPWSELGRAVVCARGIIHARGPPMWSIGVAMALLATAAVNSLN
jgi:hypothetical protein